MRVSALLAAVALALVISACGSSSTAPTPPSKLTVSPAMATVDMYTTATVLYTVTGGDVSACVWSSPAGNFSNVANGNATLNLTTVGTSQSVSVTCSGEIGSTEISVARSKVDLVNLVYIRPTDRPIYAPNANSHASGFGIKINTVYIFCDPIAGSVAPQETWDTATKTLTCAKMSGVPTGVRLWMSVGDPAILNPNVVLAAIVGHQIYPFPGMLITTLTFDQGGEFATFTLSPQTGRPQ